MVTVWIVDEWRDSSVNDFTGALSTKTNQLGINLAMQRRTAIASMQPARGDIVVVFASRATPPNSPQAPPSSMAACILIPVVREAADAQQLPAVLRDHNAFICSRYHGYWIDVLADDVLARAVLARQTRHAFISYRRADSLAVASQLADRLSQDGFIAFMDERSIGRGLRFDREIAYHLDDADMIILLVSDHLDHSSWVQREISFAGSANIALLAVDLAKTAGSHSVVGAVMPDQRFRPRVVPAAETDELDPEDLDNLLSSIYRMRVAGILRRIEELLPAGRALLEARVPPPSIQDGGVPGELLEPTTGEMVRVLPFRPTADVLWQLRRRRLAGGGAIRVVYPENLPRDGRVRALRWAFAPHRPLVEILHVRKLFH